MTGSPTQRHNLSPLTLPHPHLSLSLMLTLTLIVIVILTLTVIEGRRVEGKDLAFEEEEVAGVGVQCGVLYQPQSP